MKSIFISILLMSITCHVNAQTQKITFKAPSFYPEGVAYNKAGNNFFVGSVKTGTISRIDASGNIRDFYRDSSLKSSFGMKIDAASNTLWVCTGDPNYSIYHTPESFKKQARLIGLDIRSGTKTKDIDLGNLIEGKHFINDLTLDDSANIFITDSYSPVIYKVSKAGAASVFAENGLFKGADIGLNGIAWYPKGFILTVNGSNGSVLKVDIKTKAVSKVRIDQFFPGADGLIRTADTELILVQNKGVDKVFKIVSDDNWLTAKVVSATSTEDRLQNPSTATMKGNEIYVLNSKLNEIDDISKKPSEEFTIQVAQLR